MPENNTTLSSKLIDTPRDRQVGEQVLDVQKLVAMFRRRFKLLVGVGLAVFLAVLVFTLVQTPMYTATASLIIDSRKENVVISEEVLPGLQADGGVIDSEVEILRSRQLAEKVVKALNLQADPEFNPELAPPSLLANVKASVKSALTAAKPDRVRDDDTPMTRTVTAFMERMSVRRVGLTYLMNVGFSAESPAKASKIANAVVTEYLKGQLAAKTDATKSANAYLQSELATLSGQVQEAEAEVARYRAANGLLSAEGSTLTEQEISSYNQQLATVRTSQAEEEARLRTARSQMSRGSNGDDVGEALNSEVIKNLRGKRAEVSGRVADLSSRYGPRHPDLLRAQGELVDIDGQIQAEIRRVVSNLEARVTVARERTASMQGSLGRARGTLASNTAANVRLAELERRATSLRSNQESLMRRFQETQSQQGIQRPDARVVSRATLPAKPSSPRTMLNIALGLVLAAAAGTAAVIVAEMADNGVATADDVERKLGVPYLGGLPLLGSIVEPRDRRIEPIDHVVKRPLSAFAEGFRGLRASIVYAAQQPAKIITLSSSLPDEGKTTCAIGLARVAAQAGGRVLLVDGDLRRRALTRTLMLTPVVGVAEVLVDGKSLAEAVVRDEASGAYILPASESSATKDPFSGPALDQLLAELRERFDVVIIDTPPVLAVADARTLALKSDAVALLVRWRKTPARAALSALKLLQQSGAPLVGVALSRVDMKAQSRHGYGDAGYYYSEYSKYYSN
jgi:succinoglycan biosynthesis transport protein ExoP